jgi:hypothetical protein
MSSPSGRAMLASMTEPRQPVGQRQRRRRPVERRREKLSARGVGHVMHEALPLGELRQVATDRAVRSGGRACGGHGPSSRDVKTAPLPNTSVP